MALERSRYSFLFLALSMLLSACGGLQTPAFLPIATPEATSAVESPAPAVGQLQPTTEAATRVPGPVQPSTGAAPGVLFSDDFTNPLSGWDVRRDSDAITDYEKGEFVIFVGKQNTALWSKPNRHLGDVSIEVDAREAAGPDDNLYGVICRYQDPSNFYRLVIAGNGFAGITKRAQGKVTVLSGAHLTRSTSVHRGHALNHIKGVCQGNQLSLYVNDQLVAQATDGDFPEGDTGLIASAGKHPGVEIHFTSYIVRAP